MNHQNAFISFYISHAAQKYIIVENAILHTPFFFSCKLVCKNDLLYPLCAIHQLEPWKFVYSIHLPMNTAVLNLFPVL